MKKVIAFEKVSPQYRVTIWSFGSPATFRYTSEEMALEVINCNLAKGYDVSCVIEYLTEYVYEERSIK